MTGAVIARRLKVARARKGWTQERVAAEVCASGVTLTNAALSYYERGEAAPSLVRALALADVLGVSLDWLVGRRPITEGARQEQRVSEMVEVHR